MKKNISLILAVLVLLSLFVSCSKSGGPYNYKLSKYVELPEYKGLPAEAIRPLTDEEIEATIADQVQAAVNYYARLIKLGEGHIAQRGEVAIIDYLGYVPSVSDNPIANTNVQITLGMGSYPEELESAIIGHKAGDTFTVNLTLPDPFEDYPDYSGKDAELFVSINSICEKEAPEYTDDFARAYLFADSMADYEQSIRDSYAAINDKSFYDSVTSQTWDKLVAAATVKEYPSKEFKHYYDKIVNSVEEYVETLGLDFAAFVESNFGMTESEFYDYATETAKASVKTDLVAYAIAQAEGIKVTSEDYKTVGLEIARSIYGYQTLAELENVFTHEQIETAVLTRMVQHFICDNADIEYKD